MKDHKSKIWVAYPQALTFSGQTSVTLHMVSELQKKGRKIETIMIPALDRKISNPLKKYGIFFWATLIVWLKSFAIIFDKKPIVYFNHGQSLASFLRMGVPHLIIAKLNRSAKIVTTLHGHIFTGWKPDEFNYKFFKRLIANSHIVTVSGNYQKEKLIDYGDFGNEILVLDNLCEFEITSKEDCLKKHSLTEEQPVKILFLSLLAESKGYPQFLEAIESLAEKSFPRKVEVTLCGTIHLTRFCVRFTDPKEIETWIDTKIESINANESVSAKWIKGAWNEDMVNLFREAHIFVLPTTFKTESQPLVLLNAMGGGCAIISSTAGEIESAVSRQSGILLENPNKEGVADSIRKLISDDNLRKEYALNGAKRANEKFSLERYTQTWDEIFTRLVKI